MWLFQHSWASNSGSCEIIQISFVITIYSRTNQRETPEHGV